MSQYSEKDLDTTCDLIDHMGEGNRALRLLVKALRKHSQVAINALNVAREDRDSLAVEAKVLQTENRKQIAVIEEMRVERDNLKAQLKDLEELLASEREAVANRRQSLLKGVYGYMTRLDDTQGKHGWDMNFKFLAFASEANAKAARKANQNPAWSSVWPLEWADS